MEVGSQRRLVLNNGNEKIGIKQDRLKSILLNYSEFLKIKSFGEEIILLIIYSPQWGGYFGLSRKE